MNERRFPVMADRGSGRIMIPWSLAEEAYLVYDSRYGGGGQSLERVAERGGFGASEMDLFRPGWRPVAQELDQLRAQLAAEKADNEALTDALKFYANRDIYGMAEISGCPLAADRDSNGHPGENARMTIAMVATRDVAT